MHSVKIILTILLISVFVKAFGIEKTALKDTTKRIPNTHHKKHTNWARAIGQPPDSQPYYTDCVFTHQYTIAQRLRKYPFNKAAKILAISYDGSAEPNVDINIGDDTTKEVKRKPHGLIFHSDTLDMSNLFEIKQLTPEEINRLTNIVFNTRVRIPNYNPDPGTKCFEPRNALVFYNKEGKVFDYIEVCFECMNYESKSNKLFLTSAYCNQQFDLIKKFLTDIGIKFGTTTTDASKFN
ncbi:MAG TPA: hypothetical protein VHB54_03250 [Mucilaginibacter sp.]|nr:hypothetical protein [Mucilaginibacter sp.]